MNERIEQLRAEGLQAIDAAASTEGLEEVRIAYLGRRAELPNLLRGVSELPPEQRGAVGKAANEARRQIEMAIDRRQGELAGAELDARLAADRVDVTLPADPAPAVGRLHLITQTRREIEDVFLSLGFAVSEGPEVEHVYYNFDALNHDPTHPARAWTDTFYVSDDVLLRTHTSPMQIRAMELQPPPIHIIVPGRVYRRDSDVTHTPQFHQVEGLAVDEDITLADLKGTLLAFARAIFGPEREVRVRPHFFPFTEPSVEVDVSCFNCTDGITASGERCNLCKGTAWIEILGAGMVDPNVSPTSRNTDMTPSTSKGSRSGWGSNGSRCSSTASPTCGSSTTTTSASWSSRHACPSSWLHEYCAPDLDAHALAERLAMTGTEVERVEYHGARALEHFVVGHVLERSQHPDADRLSVCIVDVGSASPEQIVCGAPNVDAGQTVGVARPGAVMPDGTRLKVAKLRGVASNGMILAEDEVAIGTDHDGIMVLEDGIAPGTPLDTVLPIATEVLVLEITPNRPDCLGIYGVAREVHAATGAPLSPPPWTLDPGTFGGIDGVEIIVDGPGSLPAVHRARVRRCSHRTEPVVAEGAADGRRTATDLQRRRHHQLRDAADRADSQPTAPTGDASTASDLRRNRCANRRHGAHRQLSTRRGSTFGSAIQAAPKRAGSERNSMRDDPVLIRLGARGSRGNRDGRWK